ncbi:hypothetical protein E5S70_04965 [Ensifer adhaerens]|uniref:hypothetical protein n=1 Tax=Ensifer canadensis TaxID=555315 RepID=UPI00148F8EA6|nr:hypothetical protein [Ensifer canadensis]NOV15444.1 hypothetical protein [Ensifer canadensis]
MYILVIVALVLAWPTYGLSILAWFVLRFIRISRRVAAQEKAVRAASIESMFQGRYDKFFRLLDLPILFERSVSDEDAMRGGRHIAKYLIHNEEEATLFREGIREWCEKDYWDPFISAEMESENGKAKIHLAAYRAIVALMTNNGNLRCFNAINYGKLVEAKTLLEIQAIAGTLPRNEVREMLEKQRWARERLARERS